MASYRAISVIGESVLGYLEQARPADDFAATRFALYDAAAFQNDLADGVTLFVYRVAINRSRREPLPLRPEGKGRPPLPVDVYFLLTTWGSAAKQQDLMGFCMRALEDMPVLPPGLLRRYGGDTFGPDEAVEIVNESLSVQDLNNIWESLKATMRLSVAYVARSVHIGSQLVDPLERPVQTRGFGFGTPEER